MGEGDKDQGGRSREAEVAILDAFPLKRQSVLTAFKNLGHQKDFNDVKKAVDEEIGILGRTNIYASISFGNLLEYYTADVTTQVRRGNAICHQALRLGSKGELPKFTEEFVQAYDDEEEKKLGEERFDGKQMSLQQAGVAKRQAKVDRFREFEPAISKIVERKLRAGSRQWKPEEDGIYKGFIDLYSLFREGCSDPKNFAEKPS